MARNRLVADSKQAISDEPGHGCLGVTTLREHKHFTVVDLIFRENMRTGFRIYLNLRVGKTCLDRSEGFDFVDNGDKE